jgi:hypothetical protein
VTVCQREAGGRSLGRASGGSGRDRGAAGPEEARQDRADARLLRTLLLEGRFPESWIPPAHVPEIRNLGRLYCTLMDERRPGSSTSSTPSCSTRACPSIRALLSAAGRAALANAELSAAGRRYVDTALRRDDLNHNLFRHVWPTKYAADPHRPRGRSSSLRCGRSTSTPTRVHRPTHMARTRPNNGK